MRTSTNTQPTTHPHLDWRLWTLPNSTSHARLSAPRNPALSFTLRDRGVLERVALAGPRYDDDEAHRFDLSVGVRVLVYENSLWLMSRATSFSHTPTPAESPSYPRAQDVLVAPSA